MAWMMDTYSMQVGYAVPEIVTGKPIAIGGSVFRHEATGAGVVMVPSARASGSAAAGRAALRRPGLRQRGRDRGARSCVERGAKVRRRLGRVRRVVRPRGLDIAAMTACAHEHGTLADYPEGERITNDELLELPCDILVLAAREEQVTAENAERRAGAADRRGRERADLARGGRDPAPTAASPSSPTCSPTPAA